MVAVALRNDDIAAPEASAAGRGEVLARYRHLRQISRRHNSRAADLAPKEALLNHARRLGLADGRTFVVDSMDELTLALDLVVYTASVDRSRAIDRYARAARFAPGSDEARVIDAMCNARFGVLVVERRHEAAGLIVTDLYRESEFWLVDEGWEASLPDGTAVATRYYKPDRFYITAGVAVPVSEDLLARALASTPFLLRKPPDKALGDRRFAEAVYRAAIFEGVTQRMRYQDAPRPDEA